MRYLNAALALGVLTLAAACSDRAPLEPMAAPDPLLSTAAVGPRMVLNEVMADPSAVADDAGEWI